MSLSLSLIILNFFYNFLSCFVAFLISGALSTCIFPFGGVRYLLVDESFSLPFLDLCRRINLFLNDVLELFSFFVLLFNCLIFQGCESIFLSGELGGRVASPYESTQQWPQEEGVVSQGLRP